MNRNEQNKILKIKTYKNTAYIYSIFGIIGLFFPCPYCSIYNLIIPSAFIGAGILNTFLFIKALNNIKEKNKVKLYVKTKYILMLINAIGLILTMYLFYIRLKYQGQCGINWR